MLFDVFKTIRLHKENYILQLDVTLYYLVREAIFILERLNVTRYGMISYDIVRYIMIYMPYSDISDIRFFVKQEYIHLYRICIFDLWYPVRGFHYDFKVSLRVSEYPETQCLKVYNRLRVGQFEL